MDQTVTDRGLRINGAMLRHERKRLCLTQGQLANKSGYSDRLIRKAEAGQTISYTTLSDLVAALREGGSALCETDLISDPSSFARAFLECYDHYGVEMLKYCPEIFADQFVLDCAGDPSVSRLAGVHRGLRGLQRWLGTLLSSLQRAPDHHLNPIYFTQGHLILARFTEAFLVNGLACPPTWVNLLFEIHQKQITRIRVEFDTLAESRLGMVHRRNANRQIQWK